MKKPIVFLSIPVSSIVREIQDHFLWFCGHWNLSNGLTDGTKESVTITGYPDVVGNLVGSFKARLYDKSDKRSEFYDVSETFTLRRTQ